MIVSVGDHLRVVIYTTYKYDIYTAEHTDRRGQNHPRRGSTSGYNILIQF